MARVASLKTKSFAVEPPSPLGQAGSQLWGDITGDFEIEDSASKYLLHGCCLAADRVSHLRAKIDANEESGKAHIDLVKLELANLAFINRTLKALTTEKRPPGRPPQPVGWIPPTTKVRPNG